jgi:hypothetical protein
MRIDVSDTLTLSFGTLDNRNLETNGDFVIGGGASKADAISEVVQVRGKSGDWAMGVENTNFASNTDFFIGTSSSDLDVFKIERDGDVGIGTATPSAKLDIVGDLEVNGVVNVSPTTRYLSIPAASFTPELDTMDYKQNGYNVYGTTTGQLVRFWAPVELPHGAVIKEFACVVDDNFALTGFDVTAFMYEWPHFGGNGTIISHRFTTGAPGAYLAMTETENHTVDNANNHYLVSVDWDTPTSGNVWDIRLRSVRITYEITQLAP